MQDLSHYLEGQGHNMTLQQKRVRPIIKCSFVILQINPLVKNWIQNHIYGLFKLPQTCSPLNVSKRLIKSRFINGLHI